MAGLDHTLRQGRRLADAKPTMTGASATTGATGDAHSIGRGYRRQRPGVATASVVVWFAA